MNLNLSDSDFYNAYGIFKEDVLEVLIGKLDKTVEEIKEVLKWNKEHFSQSQENQNS